MVRTKESYKGGGKSLGKVSVASNSPAPKKGGAGSSGGIRGNTLVQRETPQWQKPITQFFPQPSSSSAKHSNPNEESVSTEVDKSNKENVSTSTITDKSPKKENVSFDDKINDDSD